MHRPLATALACLIAAAPGLGQEQPPPAPTGAPTGAPGGEPRQIRLEDLPPGLRLGVRAQAVKGGWPAVPTVVIVGDEASYAEAIAAWTLKARYPVLIDDGSALAREDIARFVRAYKPERVVRWAAKGESGKPPAWPTDAAARRAAIESALLRVWRRPMTGETETPTIENQAQLVQRWAKLGAAPPGVVAADAADPAWPAALALAAGRCQPIVWVSAEANINGAMTAEGAEALERAIEAGCEATGLPWRALGDALDAVTLCLNAPAKVARAGGDVIATTDLLARHPEQAEGPPSRMKGERWGWCGQVFGTAPQAAYRAMCGLFLTPERAWLFDGYKDEKPWSNYDATAAADPLRKINLDVTVDDTPRQGERAWRQRSSGGMDAGLITVNSHGNADDFNLEPGLCRPGDVPFLRVPSIVYFVHSYSAAVPGERTTVAGRWLERGAYAYLGSVQEPYLHAFLPTPAVTARLAAGVAWGSAVRFDDKTEAWKLATIGDPLITLGKPAPRATGDVPLEGAQDLRDTLRSAAAEQRYEEAVWTLTMLGRDADAARLVGALIRDEPKAFTAAVAAAAVMPLMRARDAASVARAFATFSKPQSEDGPRRDALWHAAHAAGGEPDEAMLAALRTNLRPDQVGRDAAELARPVAQRFGRDAASGMLVEARSRATRESDRARIEDAFKMLNLLPVRVR